MIAPAAWWRRSPKTVLTFAAVAAAFAASALMPLPPALAADDPPSPLFAALSAAGIVALLLAPLHVVRAARGRAVAVGLTAIALAAGIGAFTLGGYARRACTASYNARPIVIGTELTEAGIEYRRTNPQLSSDDLLFDAAGVVDRVWTRPSIDRCRTLIGSTYFLWAPCLIAALAAAVQVWIFAGLTSIASRRTGTVAVAAGAPVALRYDVFISYRHGGRDTEVARELLERLDGAGYRVAIDERDFAANASFLVEMERCVRESRYTLAIVSPRYLESGNCEEEAVVCKVLDMGDRKRRLIPFVIEPVAMPAWLYNIVGIDCTKKDPLIEPLDKLTATLGQPAKDLA